MESLRGNSQKEAMQMCKGKNKIKKWMDARIEIINMKI